MRKWVSHKGTLGLSKHLLKRKRMKYSMTFFSITKVIKKTIGTSNPFWRKNSFQAELFISLLSSFQWCYMPLNNWTLFTRINTSANKYQHQLSSFAFSRFILYLNSTKKFNYSFISFWGSFDLFLWKYILYIIWVQ